MELRCLDKTLPLDQTAVMGVLNVTPDSFSDGGLWLEPRAAIKHGLEMVEQGATIIDVGGESTRPGAEPVPLDEELRRVLPVVEGLAGSGVEFLSIDTRKTEVARRAVEAGANMINDTAGEESDRSMDRLAADTGAAIIVMHSRGTPANMRSLTTYEDLVRDVGGFLQQRAEELRGAGVAADAIAVDPGIGFAKTAEQSVELLARIGDLVNLGYPVLVGPSRKSFIGKLLGFEEGERVEATAASVAWVVARGARLVRVHDVEANVRSARMTELILSFDHA